MASVPKVTPIPTPTALPPHNILAFRTKVGAEPVKGGESKVLGTVDTSQFERIRLVADERVGSTCNVAIRLTITEGSEWVAFLDHLILTPHSQLTKVYEVPTTKLTVAIDGIGAQNTEGAVDILIYGQF